MIGLGTPSALSFKVPSSKKKACWSLCLTKRATRTKVMVADIRAGGRVPMVLVSSKVKPGYRSVARYHHENTLRLMLEALGLESTNWPGAAKDASSMAEFFTSSR